MSYSPSDRLMNSPSKMSPTHESRNPIQKATLISTDQNDMSQSLEYQQTFKKAPASQMNLDQEATLKKIPRKKIVLYDEKNQKHFYSLFEDQEIGATSEVQEKLIDSWNDDDKRTSTTQLQRGIQQCLDDLNEEGNTQYYNDEYANQSKRYLDGGRYFSQ